MKELTNLEKLRFSIGRNLAAIRHIKGEKQESVAEALGSSSSVISRVENGSYEPLTLDFLVQICNYYEVPLSQIMDADIKQMFNYAWNNQSGSQNDNIASGTYNTGTQVNSSSDGYMEFINYLKSEIELLKQKINNNR